MRLAHAEERDSQREFGGTGVATPPRRHGGSRVGARTPRLTAASDLLGGGVPCHADSIGRTRCEIKHAGATTSRFVIPILGPNRGPYQLSPLFGCCLHLSRTSADPAQRTGELADLGDGVRGTRGRTGRGCESGAVRHDATLLGPRGLDGAAADPGDERTSFRRQSAPLSLAACRDVDSVHTRNADCDMGWVALARARCSLGAPSRCCFFGARGTSLAGGI